MTKKDFEAIASCISQTMMSDISRGQVARKLAEYFATVNPRFNKEKFLNAALRKGDE